MKKVLAILIMMSMLIGICPMSMVSAEVVTGTTTYISSDFLNNLEWTPDEGSTSKILLDQTITGANAEAVYSGTDLVSSVLGANWESNYAYGTNNKYVGPAKLEKDGEDTVLTIMRDTNKQNYTGAVNKWVPRSGLRYNFDEPYYTTSKKDEKIILSTDAKVTKGLVGIGAIQTFNEYIAAYIGFSKDGGIYVGKTNSMEAESTACAVPATELTVGEWCNLKLIINGIDDSYDAVITYEADALPAAEVQNPDFNYSLEGGKVSVSTKNSIYLNGAAASSRSIKSIAIGYGQQVWGTSFKNISLEKISYGSASLEKITDSKGAEIANGGSVWTMDGTDIRLHFNAEMPETPAAGGIIVTNGNGENFAFTPVLNADKKSYNLSFGSVLPTGNYTVAVTESLTDADGDAVVASSNTFAVTGTKKYDFTSMTAGTDAAGITAATGVTLHQGGGSEFVIGKPHDKTNVNSLVIGLNGETTDTPYIEVPVPATENDFEISFSYGSWTACFPYTELYSGESKNLKTGHHTTHRGYSYFTSLNETEAGPYALVSLPSAGAYNLGFANLFPTYTLRVNQSTSTYDIIVTNPEFKKYLNYIDGIGSHNNDVEIDTVAGTMTLRSIPLEGTLTGDKKIRLGLQYFAAANANKMGITYLSITDLGEREAGFSIDSVKYTTHNEDGMVKTELEGGESLKVIFNIVNNTDEEKSFMALCAVYDDENKLKKVYPKDVSVEPNSAKVENIYIKTGDEFDVIEAGDYAKLFIWDGINSLKPLDVVEDGERTEINSITLSSLEAEEIDVTAWTLDAEKTGEILSKKA